MTINGPKLGIETIIKSTRELIEFEIDKRPDVYLLMDTNVATDSDFLDGTYHAKDYSGLDTEELEDTIKAVEFGSELLNNPILNNPIIFIVDGVSKELVQFCKIVSERIKFYNNSPIEGNLKRKKEKFHSNHLENNKILYQQLNDICFHLSHQLDKAIYPIEDTMFYHQILGEILKISREENLKREVIVGENIPRPFRREHDIFNTDEELVALAIYLNSIKTKPVSILSNDSDIPRILEGVSLTSAVEFPDIKILNPYGRAMDEIKGTVNF